MSLEGKRVAILAEDNYEILELWYPLLYLRGEGAKVQVVGPAAPPHTYLSKHDYPANVDVAADKVSATDFDAVVVPGGFAPDRLRRYPAVLKLVKDAFDQGKVVAAICHGPWVLISAKVLSGKNVTSVSAVKDDVINAGAAWFDREMVRDGNLITSRTPDDLPAFCKAIAAALSGG